MSADAPRFSGLHVLADDDPRWKRDPLEQARAACDGGASVVQLRAKRTGDRQTLAWARHIRALTRAAGVTFVMNDRFDLALLCNADAVHLGQEDLAPADLPEAARERLGVGRSTHTLEQARRACSEPVDYVAFGPLFGTATKQSAYSARGLETLAEVATLVAPRPLVAIGGIDADGALRAARSGALGAAVVSAVAGADDMVQATRALVDALSAAGIA